MLEGFCVRPVPTTLYQNTVMEILNSCDNIVIISPREEASQSSNKMHKLIGKLHNMSSRMMADFLMSCRGGTVHGFIIRSYI